MKNKQVYIACGAASLGVLLTSTIVLAHFGHPHYFLKPPTKPTQRPPQNLRPYLRAQVSGMNFNQNVVLSEADLWSAYNNAKKTIETLWIPLNGTGQEYQNTIINNLKEIVKPGRFNPSDKQERLTVNQLLLWTYQQIINTIGFMGTSKNLPDDRKKALIGEIAQMTNDFFKISLISTKEFTDNFQKPTQSVVALINTENGIWEFTFSSAENDQLNKCAKKFAERIVPAAIEKGGADRLILLQFAAWANGTIDKELKSLRDSKDMGDADKEKKINEATLKYCALSGTTPTIKDLEPKIQEIYALLQIIKEEPIAVAAPAETTASQAKPMPIVPPTAPTVPAAKKAAPEIKKPVVKPAPKKALKSKKVLKKAKPVKAKIKQ